MSEEGHVMAEIELSLKSEVNQDDLILQQQRNLEKEISDTIPLIGEKQSLASLECEYAGDEVYRGKARWLAERYSSMRRTRPDGNCFFRAFAFAYLERLLHDRQQFQSFRELALKSKDKLIALGFPKFTLEDFHDTFMEVVEAVGEAGGAEQLAAKLNDQGYSDYVVVYLRLVASGQLQQDAAFYQNFIEGDRTVADFCSQEVEPMFKESDHIHVIALSAALGVGVRVRYMDRGGTASHDVIAHDFPDDCPEPAVHLLYRPGHYDILYATPP